MSDFYQYPVFFECRGLLEDQMKKVEKYFRIRRKSGGGECGPLKKVGDNFYSVAFRHKKDQQEVLQRSEHVLKLEDGCVVFTVHDSLEPPTSSYVATPAAPAQTPEHIPSSSPISSSEEYELHLNNYLLRYIKESPHVEQELEKGLATLDCSAELYSEEGRVLVKRFVQPGAGDEGDDWKAEVDRLFDDYVCHCEVNPHTVEALLSSCSSDQTLDEVKVYTNENGMAVVVGKQSQVNARLLDVEESSCLSDSMAALNLGEESTTIASYSLYDRIRLLLCQGDIAKQYADALVNAANENLDHSGGVAAVLSQAGGPDVQRESDELVKYTGKIPIGEVVVTTSGNLNCKKLLHAVWPLGGKTGNREMVLMERTVHNVLKLAEIMQFQSIAMPCISSGVCGVPLTEALVSAVKEFSSQGGRSLNKIILIDNQEEVVRAMQEVCDRLLKGIGTGNSIPIDLGLQLGAPDQDAARETTAGAPGCSVQVEVVHGTIETQEVDAVVSPMIGYCPRSTRVGNSLFEIVGSQMTASFKREAKDEATPGDVVTVGGLPGLQSKAVFFLSLLPWDDDPDGIAVQVLRLGINTILSNCVNRGFGSVAFPVLGAGIVLKFPVSVVERVLKEQVQVFEQERASITPLLIRIVIHPNDTESSEVFRSVQPCKFTDDDQDEVSTAKRIVLLGKTGYGKSHLGNTIFGEEVFAIDSSPNSGTSRCQAETKTVNGRSITLIDTPGFFDTGRPEEDLKPEIMSCMTECAPGPHAFVIVLRVDKFSVHERDVITKICQYFSDDALKYAVVVFTHGDQLLKGMKIEEFVSKNRHLHELVLKCGGRCHVFDNKYWKNKQPGNYRSNQFQVEELLKTIDRMVMEQNGGHYTNKMMQHVEAQIQERVEHIRCSKQNMTPNEIRKEAQTDVLNNLLTQLAGTATGVLLGAFLGVEAVVRLLMTAVRNTQFLNLVKKVPSAAGVSAAALGEAGLITVGAVGLVAATAGGVMGGVTGNEAAKEAKTPAEAAERAYKAVMDKRKSLEILQ